MPKIVDKQAMQARILDAAATVFSATGFQSAKMSDVAQQAGLAKGTLYLYFPSKDALITALVDSFFAETNIVMQGQKDPETLAEFLSNIQNLLTQGARQPDRMKLFGKIFWLALEDNAVQRPIQHFRDAVVARFSQQITYLIHKDEIRSGDPDQLAATLVAMLDGILLHQLLFDTYQGGGDAFTTILHAAFSPS